MIQQKRSFLKNGDAGVYTAMTTSNRRQFITGLAGCSFASSSLSAFAQAQTPGTPILTPPPQGYGVEAERLTKVVQRTFWDKGHAQYRAPVRSAETVDSDRDHNNAYVLWPTLLGFYALVEGEKANPGQYRAQMRAVFDGMEAYFDPAASAYNAWRQFPGNNDKYFDDNAWLTAALAEAFEVTREVVYQERAVEIGRNFLPLGWDKSGNPGGQRWGTDPTKPGTGDRNACSTVSLALAAISLTRLGIDRAATLAMCRAALNWTSTHLRDTDDLIQDGLHSPDWAIMTTKWTYNTGALIRAYVDLYRFTGDRTYLNEAKRLAKAATDRSKRLYDGLVQNPEHRFWYDSSFFVPHLAEGLLALYRETRDETLREEVRRNANYAYHYLRDPADGLYWRNWRLWRIGAPQLETWHKLTGQDHPLEPDDSERSKEARFDKVAVADRPLVKTLLANAGMARLFWLLAQT
ncbi:MAG: hypothetical protein JWN14_4070 [Chthonomonadales bacterium]|nr:hypothetical protein [Chthonomonadales bacterium]